MKQEIINPPLLLFLRCLMQCQDTVSRCDLLTCGSHVTIIDVCSTDATARKKYITRHLSGTQNITPSTLLVTQILVTLQILLYIYVVIIYQYDIKLFSYMKVFNNVHQNFFFLCRFLMVISAFPPSNHECKISFPDFCILLISFHKYLHQ